MDIKVIFGENLKFYRKTKHLSQEQLSEKVDISVKHLSSIERGSNFISSDLLYMTFGKVTR
jgi:transcriptional regulator with XRE-family HTH domain